MDQVTLEERVSTLESLMAELLRVVIRTQQQLEQTQAQVEQTSRELRAFKDEMRTVIDRMNKQWGDLANKMGTMAEDLVAPSIPRILRTVIGCPDDAVDSIAVRVQRRHPVTHRMQEFDVVATCGEYVLVTESKSKLNPGDISDFVALLPQTREYFREYADKKIVGAIASLYVDPSLVRYGEREGLIVLGSGEHIMDVLNSPGFTPKVF